MKQLHLNQKGIRNAKIFITDTCIDAIKKLQEFPEIAPLLDKKFDLYLSYCGFSSSGESLTWHKTDKLSACLCMPGSEYPNYFNLTVQVVFNLDSRPLFDLLSMRALLRSKIMSVFSKSSDVDVGQIVRSGVSTLHSVTCKENSIVIQMIYVPKADEMENY